MAEKNSEALFKEVSILLRSLITPYNNDGGIRLSKLYEEYNEEEQEELPFRALGYSSITALLDDVENVHLVRKYDDWYATTTPNSKTAHIHELIANQKSSNKNKAPHSQGIDAERMPSYRPPSGTQSRFSSAPSSSDGYNRSRPKTSNGRLHHKQSAGKMPSRLQNNMQLRFTSALSSSYGNRSRSQPSNDRPNHKQSAGKLPSRSETSIQSRFSSAQALMISLITPEIKHGGIPIPKLFWKYEEAAPEALTYKALGYKSFSAFIRDIDNVQISQNSVGSYVVTSSHIHVNTQQLSKKRKRGDNCTDIASSRPNRPKQYDNIKSSNSVQQKLPSPSPPTVTRTPLSQRKVHVYLPESAKKSEPTTPPSNSSSTKSDTEFRKPDVPSLSSSRSHHSSNDEISSRTRVPSSSPSNNSKIPVVVKKKEELLPPSSPPPPSPPLKVSRGSRSTSNKEEECWSFDNEDWNQ